MATVTNWIDHLSAKEVAGAVYPGAGSAETLLVILGFVIWIGWHVITSKSESDELLEWLKRDMVLMITRTTLPIGN
tara:strand:- start:178 stop:405 length:228 start_codon:yes stop_codon:yes gene_type:complete